MRLLIVEDEKELADGLALLFERSGYTVNICYDGVSGLDEILSGVYDLDVLDIMLPGKDGISVLKTRNLAPYVLRTFRLMPSDTLLCSVIVSRMPPILNFGLILLRTSEMASLSWATPNTENGCACIGIITSLAAVRALTSSSPSAGAQSIRQ